MANAVQVQTKANVSETPQIIDNFAYRVKWREYVGLCLTAKDLKNVVPFVYTAHLPFSFITGAHGSGERHASDNSFENLAFELLSKHETAVPIFTVMISAGGILSHKCSFLPSELESLKLVTVDDSKFSQAYQDRNLQLVKSHSALDHYLLFRGFSLYPINQKDIPQGALQHTAVSLLNRVYIPDLDHDNSLLKTARV